MKQEQNITRKAVAKLTDEEAYEELRRILNKGRFDEKSLTKVETTRFKAIRKKLGV
jgi:hypothetical protein